jgi:hypothetical protein
MHDLSRIAYWGISSAIPVTGPRQDHFISQLDQQLGVERIELIGA